MKVYVIGKVRGLKKEEARNLFEKAEKRLESMGMDVVNPFTLAEELDEVTDERKLRMYLLNELSKCDAVWMMDNWRQDSDGAACEFYFAKSTKMKILNYSEESLLAKLLSQRYRPHGQTEELMVKSTAEIAYEVEDMCEASALEVSGWLHQRGFGTVTVDGKVNWIVYEVPESTE